MKSEEHVRVVAPTPGDTIIPSGVERPSKPRQRGLTMIIDKGLGLAETKSLLDTAARHIDFIKFGFGTTLLYPPDVLQQKVRTIVEAGVAVLPGGTLLEIAGHEGTTAQFFELAQKTGFTHIEVSDGTIELSAARRRELICRARDLGFRVLSEVGKKDPDHRLQAEFALRQIALDLDAGVEKVIVEGRDSGVNIGIFDGSGAVRDSLFEHIVSGLSSLDDVMWEAPRTSQQQELLVRLGPHVNFGNVQPPDIITLEAMRQGLRGDTLRLRLEGASVQWV